MKESTTPTLTESILTPISTVARRVGLIMTYNQRETCIEAINSIINQTLALDLIIISDDCSTDGTYEAIKNYLLQNNQHSNIKVYQSEKNLGFIPHFNAAIKEHCAESDLIYYNAGDDVSEVNRVEEFYRDYVAKENPRYFLGHSYVTSFGSGNEAILVPPIESIKDNRELCLIASAYHIGASQVFTGALFFDFGPILFDDCYEDLTLGYRALLKNAYHFVPKALLRYRVGGLSSWQKNPLEKKRGRLKSTLTQRAVDSIRSGDFEALSTIQDCYSQYGFSHTPHKDRLKILIVGELANESDIYGYSIAKHFPVIWNVCQVEIVPPDSFLHSDFSSLKTQNADLSTLVWLKVPKLKHEFFQTLMSSLSNINNAKLVFDFGLLSHIELITPNRTMLQLAAQLADRFPKAFIHTSCPNFYSRISALSISPHTTYLPPLQYIDGPDPVIERPKRKRGVVFVLGSSNATDLALSKIKDARRIHGSAIEELQVIQMAKNKAISSSSISSSAIDFVVVLIDPGSESPSSMRYLWGFGSRIALPIFVNAESPSQDDLKHGENCLFVGSDVKSWSAAFNLLSTDYDALRQVALRARRDAYFNFSIQKRVREVSELIGKASSKNVFFNKFLPL
jgi:glycosyltransferase involved in cell wall biosynthesis